MKIAYLVNRYPTVSHSFIRREILAHEAAGFNIARYALRSEPAQVVDEADRREETRCRYVQQQKPLEIARCVCAELVENPAGVLRAAALACRIGWRSDRGLFRHFAYWVEACVIAQWCRADDITHLHAHFGTNSAAIAMLAREMTDLPYSFTVHGPEEFDKPEFLALGKKIARAAFVVAVSSFGRSQLFRWAALRDWDKVRVVHCGIEPDFYAGEIVPPPQAGRLVCIARLSEQKGLLLLIHAARRLSLASLDFELVIVGDGPLQSELDKLIRHYELEKRISITGWVDSARVRDEIVKARALVLPSFAEGLPVVIMEAMALGRPAIATYIAGIPELVGAGTTGWLVPAGDVTALARAMSEAIEAPVDTLAAMGARAREMVRTRHDSATEAAKLRDAIAAAARPTS
jgi:colanic acid/amylovoran biosynthesis glycosyltransferase